MLVIVHICLALTRHMTPLNVADAATRPNHQPWICANGVLALTIASHRSMDARKTFATTESDNIFQRRRIFIAQCCWHYKAATLRDGNYLNGHRS